MVLFKIGVIFHFLPSEAPLYLIYLYKLLHHRTDVGYNEYEAKQSKQLVDIRCLDILFRAFLNKYNLSNI